MGGKQSWINKVLFKITLKTFWPNQLLANVENQEHESEMGREPGLQSDAFLWRTGRWWVSPLSEIKKLSEAI